MHPGLPLATLADNNGPVVRVIVIPSLSRRRWIAAGGVFVVVATAVVGAVLAFSGGSSGFTGPTAAELYAKEAKFGTFQHVVPGQDPDEQDRGGNNVDDTVTFLGNGRYRLTVQNVGFLGYINSFQWDAPNIVITKILGSSAGACTVGALTTAVPASQYGSAPESSVRCTGMAIPPPKCSCQGGGTATVTFAGHQLVSTKKNGVTVQYGVEESRLVVGDSTLVPYHIPSYLGSGPNQVDLPLCAKGETSTSARPCVHTS